MGKYLRSVLVNGSTVLESRQRREHRMRPADCFGRFGRTECRWMAIYRVARRVI
jgi:hypothetical protein